MEIYVGIVHVEMMAGIDLGARFCLQLGVNVTSGQTLSALASRSARECQDACQATDGCEHFNFLIDSDGSSTGFGSCVLIQASTSGQGFVQTGVAAAYVSGPSVCKFASVRDVAGTRNTAGAIDSVNPLAAQLSEPAGLGSWQDQLFVADSANHLIRQMDMATGAVMTVAGTGSRGFTTGDDATHSALARTLDAPHAVDVNQLGHVFFTDSINNRILGFQHPQGISNSFAVARDCFCTI